MHRSLQLCIAAAVLLAACAPERVIEASKFETGQQMVCRDVVPVGSHLKERICTTVAADKESSNRAKAVLEEAQQRRAADALLQRGGRRPEGP